VASIDAKMALLQLLISGPSFGLELMERLEGKTKGKMKLSQGATYEALRTMEGEGLVESYLGDEKVPERGGRPRRYFKLTAEGRRVGMEDRATAAGLFDLIPAKVRALVAAIMPEAS
jgi:PadR family transcriptional regulator PadR